LRRFAVVLLTLALLVAGISTAVGAAQRKPKPKLKPSPSARVPGPKCVFGQAYTIGSANAMDLTIKGAEYSATRIRIGDETTFPGIGEKLLVVHFTTQNPLPKDRTAGISTFDWTVVDSMDSNHAPEFRLAGREPGSDVLGLPLKQGRKADGYVFFRLSDNCTADRIIVKNHRDTAAPAAEYTKFQVEPLAPPFSVGRDEIPAQIGTVYPTGYFDMKLEAVRFVDVDAVDPTSDARLVVFAFWIKNNSLDDFGPASGNGFCYFLTDSEGRSLERAGGTFDSATGQPIDLVLKPGAEARYYIRFPVSTKACLGDFTISEGEGRTFKYDLRGMK
jgi:hypothetical protein